VIRESMSFSSFKGPGARISALGDPDEKNATEHYW
jgi:hypothetical protein